MFKSYILNDNNSPLCYIATSFDWQNPVALHLLPSAVACVMFFFSLLYEKNISEDSSLDTVAWSCALVSDFFFFFLQPPSPKSTKQ